MPNTVLLSKWMTENIPFLCVLQKYHMPITFALIYSIRFIVNVRFTSTLKIRIRICVSVCACMRARECVWDYTTWTQRIYKKKGGGGLAHKCIYITNTCRPGNEKSRRWSPRKGVFGAMRAVLYRGQSLVGATVFCYYTHTENNKRSSSVYTPRLFHVT